MLALQAAEFLRAGRLHDAEAAALRAACVCGQPLDDVPALLAQATAAGDAVSTSSLARVARTSSPDAKVGCAASRGSSPR